MVAAAQGLAPWRPGGRRHHGRAVLADCGAAGAAMSSGGGTTSNPLQVQMSEAELKQLQAMKAQYEENERTIAALKAATPGDASAGDGDAEASALCSSSDAPAESRPRMALRPEEKRELKHRVRPGVDGRRRAFLAVMLAIVVIWTCYCYIISPGSCTA